MSSTFTVTVPSATSLLKAQSFASLSLSSLSYPFSSPFGYQYFSPIPITIAAPTASADSSTSSSSSSSSASALSESDAKDPFIVKLHNTDWSNVRRVPFTDYCGLLGLEEKRFVASVDEVKTAWRILQRLCHPDKAKNEDRDRAELRFKAIQQGVEILCDPSRRKGYDSSLPFDDSLPGEREGLGDDFFSVYGPVFRRNERYFSRKNVPRLGDISSSDDSVREFYHFWTTFESWREFADLNESKPENASYREEKRRLERENKKKQEAAKKDEMKRVFKLADDAMRKDPRIKRIEREAEEAKKKKKDAKNAHLRVAEEAKKKADEEAKLAIEAAAAKEKSDKEAEKERKVKLKSLRSYMGKYAKTNGFNEDDVTKLKENLSLEELSVLVAQFKTEGEAAKMATETCKKFLSGEKINMDHIQTNGIPNGTSAVAVVSEKKTDEKEKPKETSTASATSSSPTPTPVPAAAPAANVTAEKEKEKSADSEPKKWSADEVDILTRAVNRFPAGVQSRWEKITEMVNTLGGKRNVKEILRKQKEVESGIGESTVSQEDAYALYLKKMHKTEEKGTDKEKEKSNGVDDELSIRIMQQKIDADNAKNEKDNKEKEKSKEKEIVWNAEEQKSFEKGLSDVGKDLPDRWEKISALVVTKNPKQCQERFKFIKEEIIRKKATGTK